MKPKIKTVRRRKKLKRIGEQSPSKKQWIVDCREFEEKRLKKFVLIALLVFFGVSLTATIMIIVMVGFNFRGFVLPESLLDKMGWATIGQTTGLVSVALKFVFKT